VINERRAPRPVLAVVTGAAELIGTPTVTAFKPDRVFLKPVDPAELLGWIARQVRHPLASDGDAPQVFTP
jgi:hypothetical protein